MPWALAMVAVPLLGCGPAPNADSRPDLSDAEQGGSGPSTSTTLDDYSGFAEEYSAGVAELTTSLPDGWSLPAEPPGEWETEGRYESGLGYMTAAFVVQCAWMLEYSQGVAEGDRRKTERALEQIRAWIEIPGVRQRVDDVYAKDWIERVTDPAEEGDPAFLLDLAAGC